MILVDASVWIDHLRRSEPRLAALLDAGGVICHPFVIGEVGCGHLRQRERMLATLARLPQAAVATHAEALGFLERQALAGRGVGWADVHLLASTALTPGARLWTKDKRLAAAAAAGGLGFIGGMH